MFIDRSDSGRYQRFLEAGPAGRRLLLKGALMKGLRLLSLPLTFSLAVLLRLILLVLKPWVQIRFARLWSFSLVPFAVPTEIYLCQRKAGFHPKRSLDLFYHYDRERDELDPAVRARAMICNEQLHRMFASKLRLWEGGRWLDALNRLLPGGSKPFLVEMPEPHDRQGILERFPPQLSFTKEEKGRGRRGLAAIGIDPEAPFVCLHVWDGGGEARARRRFSPLFGEWRRGTERSASIHNHLLAAETLTQMGYTVVRMGEYVEEPLITENPRIVDYAWKHQSDFMDVYLAAHCRFFIGPNSGLTSLALVFRKPIAFVNIYPMGELLLCDHQDSPFIPKLFYSASLERLLTFEEVVEQGLTHFFLKTAKDWEISSRLGLEILENRPEEILDLALELHERLDGTFRSSAEDEELQAEFLRFVASHPEAIPHEKGFCDREGPHLRMGARFLREHRQLLQKREQAICQSV